jgi:hypothetical protein
MVGVLSPIAAMRRTGARAELQQLLYGIRKLLVGEENDHIGGKGPSHHTFFRRRSPKRNIIRAK